MFKKTSFSILSLFFSCLLFAQTSTSGGDWEAGSNWSGGSAPDTDIDNENIIIGSGFPITRNGDIRFNSNANGSITANADFTITGSMIWSSNSNNTSITINGTWIVQGDLVLESNAGSNISIDISNGGTLIVQGDFEVANGALNGVDISSGGTMVVGGDFDLGSGSNVSNSGTVYASSTSGSGNVSGGGVADIADLVDDDPDLCATVGTCAALPVELLNFQGEFSNGIVNLTWTTASEINNDYFILEKSLNGVDFQVFTEISGNGTSTSEITYTYRDTSSSAEWVYYRLSQIDFDGKSEVLAVILVSNESLNDRLMVYPNPVSRNAEIRISGAPLGANWVIYSPDGKIRKQGVLEYSTVIPGSDLNKGLYFLMVKTINEVKTVNLLVTD